MVTTLRGSRGWSAEQFDVRGADTGVPAGLPGGDVQGAAELTAMEFCSEASRMHVATENILWPDIIVVEEQFTIWNASILRFLN